MMKKENIQEIQNRKKTKKVFGLGLDRVTQEFLFFLLGMITLGGLYLSYNKNANLLMEQLNADLLKQQKKCVSEYRTVLDFFEQKKSDYDPDSEKYAIGAQTPFPSEGNEIDLLMSADADDIFQENAGRPSKTKEKSHSQEITHKNPEETVTQIQSDDITNLIELGDVVRNMEKEVSPYVTVDDTYFNDAAFIGDSRVVSLYDYAGLENADFYCASGRTIFQLFSKPNGRFKDGTWDLDLEEGLSTHTYAKIYLMVGINELGIGDADYFAEYYEKAIKHIRELQPNALIYIQSIMNVTKERSEEGDYINNEAIAARNEKLQQFHNGKDIIYLDVNSALNDENGALNPEYSYDGVHLTASHVKEWMQYLREHAIPIATPISIEVLN